MHRCTVCGHGERAGIEAASAEGGVCQAGRRFGVPVAELYRHMRAHVPVRREPVADPIGAALEELTEAADALMGRVTGAAVDPRVAARVLGLRQRQLESLVRVQGARAKGGRVDLARTAEWADLRSVILRALAPYPEALRALGEALEGVR